MTDSQSSEQSEEQGTADEPGTRDQVGESATQQAPAENVKAERSETENSTSEVPEAKQGGASWKDNRKSLLVGLGGGVALGAVVVFALTAFLWPGFLIGPGQPDDTATKTVAALSSKNAGELDKLSCRGPDGKAVAQMPPQVLQLIQSATPAGPPHLALDTQARAPVDLTLSAQGQTQKFPADVVLGVSNGEWCMDSIAARQ